MTKIKKLIQTATAYGTVLALSPLAVLAQSDRVDIQDIDPRYKSLTNLRPSDYIKTGVGILLGTAGIIAFIFLLWGGIQWIVAGGDKEGTEKARKRITASLVGLAIVFSAYALLFIIQALFGVNFFQFELKSLGT